MMMRFTSYWYGVCSTVLLFGLLIVLQDDEFSRQKQQLTVESEVAQRLNSISDYMIIIIQSYNDGSMSEKDKKIKINQLSAKINREFHVLAVSYSDYYRLSSDRGFLAEHYQKIAKRWSLMSKNLSQNSTP